MVSGRLGSVGQSVLRVVGSARADGVRGAVSTLRNGYRWRARRVRQSIDRARRDVAERYYERTQRFGSSGGVSLEPSPGPVIDQPRIAVVVAAYNRSELLPIALRSVQMQEFEDWECIVVDDASTDDTVAIAQHFVDVDPRFRIVAHRSNRGLSAVRNTGIAAALAPFVCFLDDDDFLFADSLSARFGALEEAPPEVAATYCDWHGTDPEVGLEQFKPDRDPTPRARRFSFTSLRSGPPCISTSPLVRRDVLASVGGFDEGMTRGEDADLWQRILRLGFTFVYVDHLGVAYRRSPGSMVLGSPAAQLRTLVAIDAASDRKAPELVDHGPFPLTAPLSDLTPDSVRAPQRYRYLALVAQHDVTAAMALGHELIPEAVRWEIDPPSLTKELTSHVLVRGLARSSREAAATSMRVQQLVDGLVPKPAASWRPLVEPKPWLAERVRRGQRIRGTPTPVSDDRGMLDGAVVLIPEAEYHVAELGPLARELERRGVKTCFMSTANSTVGAARALGRYTDRVATFDIQAAHRAAAIVVLNDWGPARPLIERANEIGTPTIAKIEGVQDFDDIDTGQFRLAYRRASVVLGQGPNDLRSLPDRDVRVVGSTRLERLWREAPIEPTDHVLVNLNFTFDILTEQRRRWLASVRSAVVAAGVDASISAHPAERSRRLGLPRARKPFRYEITRAGVLVSRFSTVPFEAMARGVPFVYHNPHGERVPTFLDPHGAFLISRNADELAAHLREILDDPEAWTRDRWSRFFVEQIDIEPSRPSEARAADVIASTIR